MSSESKPRYHRVAVVCMPRTATVRTPNSAPCARAKGGDAVADSPVNGSTFSVMPRAELEWNPRPQFAYSSVPRQGPNAADTFGLTIPAVRSPELSGLWDSTFQ